MKLQAIYSLIFVMALSAAGVSAQAKQGKELREAVDQVDDASKAITEIMRADDKSIPRDLLNKAEAVVIFPGTVKAAFIVGGSGGSGVAVKRTRNGWSAPAFLNIGGASFGAQIGGSKTDYVLLVMNDDGLKSILNDKFEIGGEGSIAAGPVGRTAAASTTATLGAGILTYSRSKGLFAGVSLKGMVITHDNDRNRAIYNKTASQVLGDPPVMAADAPSALRKLGQTLSSYSR